MKQPVISAGAMDLVRRVRHLQLIMGEMSANLSRVRSRYSGIDSMQIPNYPGLYRAWAHVQNEYFESFRDATRVIQIEVGLIDDTGTHIEVLGELEEL